MNCKNFDPNLIWQLMIGEATTKRKDKIVFCDYKNCLTKFYMELSNTNSIKNKINFLKLKENCRSFNRLSHRVKDHFELEDVYSYFNVRIRVENFDEVSNVFLWM